MADCFSPRPSLLAKVGSILTHVEEANGPGGHPFDVAAIKALIADPEVQGWLDGMRANNLLPLKRGAC